MPINKALTPTLSRSTGRGGKRSVFAPTYLAPVRHWLIIALLALTGSHCLADETAPFAVQVVDDQTNRGIPLVELRSVSGVRFFTDSDGWACVDDPAFRDHSVYFTIKSDGYEFPGDPLGQHGTRLDVVPGTIATCRMHRINIAQRLYRITGEGIYRDSVMLHHPLSSLHPMLNARVVGQDSAQLALYHGRVRWFFGDTRGEQYPLGQFWTSGATSLLDTAGGLDVDRGINLTYFVDKNGFSRAMIDHRDDDPLWLDGLMVVSDAAGHDRLVGVFSKMKSIDACVGRRLAIYNDDNDLFEPVMDIPLDAPLYPHGQVTYGKEAGVDYRYFGDPIMNVRVRAELDRVKGLRSYEAFTPLSAGARALAPADERLIQRDAGGRTRWSWKADTAALTRREQRRLLETGKIAPEETTCFVHDVESKRLIELHGGSVRWNAFRRRWILIAVQIAGAGDKSASHLGEVWYSEGAMPQGPFVWARRIVTHDRYSFYNPVQHDFYDANNGLTIYFQGTYSNTFSGREEPTPRYDYNQIMYRLDLDDPRLQLPEAAPTTAPAAP